MNDYYYDKVLEEQEWEDPEGCSGCDYFLNCLGPQKDYPCKIKREEYEEDELECAGDCITCDDKHDCIESDFYVDNHGAVE